jgi:hypothetical protein
VYFAILFIHFISAEVILELSFSLIAQISHPYNEVGYVKVLFFQSSMFLDLRVFESAAIIPVVCSKSDILTVVSSSFW